MTRIRPIMITGFMSVLLIAEICLAQAGGPYDLTWNTIDGGGAMFSNGGSYSLGGTIGQPDAGPAAGPLTGGSYSLVGGFWPSTVCACPSDMNYDTKRDARDIQAFVTCYMTGVGNCGCADLDGDGILTSLDVNLFVTNLLTTSPCP